jgi:hypothetical protein
MKNEIKDKKRLQKERNVLTAQLSRDRKKLEVELLRKYCYEATQALNMIRNAILDKSKCANCGITNQNTLIKKIAF